MKATKKTFEQVAELIGNAWATLPAGTVTDATMRELMVSMADVFKESNPKFKRDLFYEMTTARYLERRQPYRPKR